jgi:hypothetical protein
VTWLSAFVAAPFRDWQHPRGRGGRFIEVGGAVEVREDEDNWPTWQEPPRRHAVVQELTPSGPVVAFSDGTTELIPLDDARYRLVPGQVQVARLALNGDERWTSALQGRPGFDALYNAGQQWRSDVAGGGLDDMAYSVASEWKSGAWRQINNKLFEARNEDQDDEDQDDEDDSSGGDTDEDGGYGGWGDERDSDPDYLSNGYHYKSMSRFLEEADEVFDMQPRTPADVILLRATSSSHASVAAMLEAKPGDVFEFPGYLATTGGELEDIRTMGLGGNVSMEILVPSGSRGVMSVDAMQGSGVNGELEMVLNRGSRLTLASEPRMEDSRWTISLVLA